MTVGAAGAASAGASGAWGTGAWGAGAGESVTACAKAGAPYEDNSMMAAHTGVRFKRLIRSPGVCMDRARRDRRRLKCVFITQHDAIQLT
jgi:hypothetical protein